MLGEIPPSQLLRVLLLIHGPWETIDQVRSVRLDSMLSEPWNETRLQRCRERLAAGERPPPIEVVGLKFRRRIWYSVGDGCHRIAAAQEAGKKTIRAKVGGIYLCDPASFVLWQGWLWRKAGDRLQGVTDDFSEEEAALMCRFGVEQLDQSPALIYGMNEPS